MATLLEPPRVPGTHLRPPPPKPPWWRRRATLAMLAAIVVAAGVTVAIVLAAGSPGRERTTTISQPTPPPITTPTEPAVSMEQVRSLLEAYAAAYSNEDVDALATMFAPSFVRVNGDDPAQDRAAALASYAEQFGELEDPAYTLTGLRVSIAGDRAGVTGEYGIESTAGTVSGAIRFELEMDGGRLMITRIELEPDAAPTPTPAPDPEPPPRPEQRPEPTYARTASIAAWFTTWSGSYIHFKAVDEDGGDTVMEQPGSDGIDLDEERAAVARTPERQRLVDALRERMEAAGWTEIGTVPGGEWYEYRFGR